jgi:4-hydroxy-2-oxoheptanedioate aldolase
VTVSGDAMARLGPYGLWCSLPTTYATEILARSGFDWLCVDLQHGFLTPGDLLAVMQTADLTDTPVLVRVEHPASLVIHRALDAGARGIIFPSIETGEQAARAAALCRYPPRGVRSWGPARLMLGNPEYNPEGADDDALCLVMIESRRALDNLDDILAVDGVDGVLVGPSDLAIDQGLPPSPLPIDGRHRRALADIADRATEQGVIPGVFADSAEGVRAYHELGYEMFGVGNDAGLLRSAALHLVEQLRGAELPDPV